MPRIKTDFASDDKEVLASLNRMKAEVDRLNGKLDNVGKTSAKSGGAVNKLTQKGARGAWQMVGGLVSVQAAIQLIGAQADRNREKFEKLAASTKDYAKATVSLSAPLGMSTTQIDALIAQSGMTRDQGTAALQSIQAGGPVSADRRAELLQASSGAAAIGQDTGQFAELVAALNKLDPKANVEQLQNQAVKALTDGIAAADIERAAGADMKDKAARRERSDLQSRLAGSEGAFAGAVGLVGSSAAGQAAQQSQAMAVSEDFSVEGLRAQAISERNVRAGEEFDRRLKDANGIQQALAYTLYGFSKTAAFAGNRDGGDELALRVNRGLGILPEDKAGDARLEAANAAALKEKQLVLAAVKANGKPTYNGLNNAESGR